MTALCGRWASVFEFFGFLILTVMLLVLTGLYSGAFAAFWLGFVLLKTFPGSAFAVINV